MQQSPSVKGSPRKIAAIEAAGLTLACLVLCVVFSGMIYLTNDDMGIQSTLAGNNTGTPFPVHQNISVLLGYPLTWLYTLVPTVQWWYAYSLLLTLVGTFMTNYGILLVAERHGRNRVAVLALLASMNVVFVLLPIARVSFTIVPAMLGGGIVSLLVAEARHMRRWMRVVSVVLFVLAFNHRMASGRVVLCFIVIAVLYVCMADEARPLSKRLVRWALTSAVLVALAVCMQVGNARYQQAVNGKEFSDFTYARTHYIDYPHDSYEQNPELYESVGWNEDLYDLVTTWCFLDERVNTETFRALTKGSDIHANTFDLNTVKGVLRVFAHDELSVEVTLYWALVSVATAVTLLLRRNRRDLVFCLLGIVAVGFFTVYLTYLSRIFYRVVMVYLLPATALNLCLLMRGANPQKLRLKRLWLVCMAVLAALSLPLVYNSVRHTFDQDIISNAKYESKVDRALSEYAIAHKDNIYVRQTVMTFSVDPRLIYPDVKPNNILSWGGSQDRSRMYYEKIHAVGLDVFDGNVFKDKGALFLSVYDLEGNGGEFTGYSTFAKFFRWQRDYYGAVGVVQVDNIEDYAHVYRLVYDEDADEPYYVYTDDGFKLRS